MSLQTPPLQTQFALVAEQRALQQRLITEREAVQESVHDQIFASLPIEARLALLPAQWGWFWVAIAPGETAGAALVLEYNSPPLILNPLWLGGFLNAVREVTGVALVSITAPTRAALAEWHPSKGWVCLGRNR